MINHVHLLITPEKTDSAALLVKNLGYRNVQYIEDYKWSSYCENAEERNNTLLAPHDQYMRIAKIETDRRKGYRAFFNGYVEDNIDEQIGGAT